MANRRLLIDAFTVEGSPAVLNEGKRFGRRTSYQVINTPYNYVQRTMDLLLAAVGLVFALPLISVISIAVAVESRGPIFYRQQRVGRGGRRFDILKFRTMIVGAEKLKADLLHLNIMSGPFFKAKNDPRITKIGKFLRSWSFDELPQLINVLKGDMSLVGPRPMLPEEVVELECFDILTVRPGLTGYWQVNGRSDVVDCWEKLEMDRYSIANRGFVFDLKIILKTFSAVLRRRGAM